MELIVAVYDDWGIGRDGTQPVALSADRKFFRETTRGAMVIVGRRTIEDFPGKKPLPGRVNVAISRNVSEIPGFTVCKTVEEAAELAKTADRAMVIGGGSIYRQMLPYCDLAHVTKIDYAYQADTYFPNLDEDPEWEMTGISEEQTYYDLLYEFCRYERKK